jgi:hypothetical protein
MGIALPLVTPPKETQMKTNKKLALNRQTLQDLKVRSAVKAGGFTGPMTECISGCGTTRLPISTKDAY